MVLDDLRSNLNRNTLFCCFEIKSYTYTSIVKFSKDKTLLCFSNLCGPEERRGQGSQVVLIAAGFSVLIPI